MQLRQNDLMGGNAFVNQASCSACASYPYFLVMLQLPICSRREVFNRAGADKKKQIELGQIRCSWWWCSSCWCSCAYWPNIQQWKHLNI